MLKNKKTTLVKATIALPVFVIVPQLLAILVTLNTLGGVIINLLHLFAAFLPVRKPKSLDKLKEEDQKFISIHIPAHNEPPEVLVETLESLARLEYKNYEVLVIDNNTSDPEIWKPVEEACTRLGDPFKFFHVENLKGFKSGALNYVRKYTNPRAEFIMVLDADYTVTSDCLNIAMKYNVDQAIGLIQFPQDYRNKSTENRGIELEYKYFFLTYMNMSNLFNCVPSTGTVSFIRVSALNEIGAFSETYITEDAEIGFRMNKAGYRGIYVNRTIGKGLMPFDLASLKKQRKRWAFGNAQILRNKLYDLTLGKSLSMKQKIGFITHLTAWINFLILPMMIFTYLGITLLFSPLSTIELYMLWVSIFTVLFHLVTKAICFVASLRKYNCSLRDVIRAYFVHLGLSLLFAKTWIECVINDKSPFVRTNKFRTPIGSIFSDIFWEIFFVATIFVSASLFLTHGLPLFGLLLLVFAVSQLSIFIVAKEMRVTNYISNQIQ